jgi:hypothetical protein
VSAQAIDFSKYEQAAPPGGQQIDFSKYEQPAAAAQPQPGMLDREIPLDSYTHATESGLQSIGRGTRDAVIGTLQMLDPRPKNQEEEAIVAADQKNRAALPVYRILRSLGHTAGDATQLAGAFHDINQSADPVGTYAKVAQETAGQGAGQALTALATEGAIKGAPAVASGVGKAAKATAGVIRDVATPENIATAAGGAVGGAIGHAVGSPFEGGTAGAVVGRAVGKAVAKRLTGAAEEAAPELDATAENKPYAGEPAPKPQPVLDATGENKPFAGGMDEYAPPKPKAPRTIVTDPSTGRPEFSDVVEAKQQTAAPLETKPAPAETPAAQPAPKPAPNETSAAEPGPSGDELLERLKGIAGRITKQEGAAPGSAEPDLTQQLQDSLDFVRARKAVAAGNAQPAAIEAAPEPGAGVMTSAAPKDLLGRWGVDQDSFTEGRAQTRGMKPDESLAAVAKLKKAYQNGQAVEPVMETRDSGNNIIDVDGRGRALAAHQAGIERIPIVVRRMPAEVAQ